MKRALIGAAVALALVGTLATAQSGIVLPAGSNTLKSIHLNGAPALGLYYPTSSTMYLGGTSGGITFSDTGTSVGVGEGFTVYGDFTDASNYESVVFSHDGTKGVINTTSAGTGTTTSLYFEYNGSTKLFYNNTTLASYVDITPVPTDDESLGDDDQHWMHLYTSRGIQGAKTVSVDDETATDFALVAIADGEAAIGTVYFGAFAGTSGASSMNSAYFACNNASDTETCDIDEIGTESQGSPGSDTIACTPAIDTDETDAVMFAVTCDQEDDDEDAMTFYYRFDMLTINTITPQ